jgi:uracil-DNA glycosylase family 4
MDLESLNRQIIACRKCPRLAAWRELVANRKRKAYRDWKYWGKPVPGFGDPRAQILVVGLAPGAHGSNRTGRQFTGDASGGFLYPALFRAGYANQPCSTARADGLALTGLFLTASGRCAPPANKPTPAELDKCQPYLEKEIEIIKPKVIVCLGQIAFARILKIFSLRKVDFNFKHGAVHRLFAGSAHADIWLLCSYHPSQQNTATGKLTVAMFDAIWARAKELAKSA